MSKQQFPPGWDEERVNRLIAHYESLREEEQVKEDNDEVFRDYPLRRCDGDRDPRISG
jgi:hypothetical protein